MKTQDFIKKWEGWLSYTNREQLKKEMEADLIAVSQELYQTAVNGSLLEKLVQGVEEKTGEKIVAIYGHAKKTKPTAWQRFKCWIGFHEYYVRCGDGYFTDNKCSRCLSFRGNGR